MKRTLKKWNEFGSLSPITNSGQPVFSSIRLIPDPEQPDHPLTELLTPDRGDAIKVLRFLDNMNGISWTPNLRRIEIELRDALHDLMTAESGE